MEIGMLVFLIILSLLIWGVIWYFIAAQFYEAAKEKGYYNKKYLWITFVFGIVGCLLVTALPDRGARLQSGVYDELPTL